MANHRKRRRRRHTPAERQAIVAAFTASGETQSRFAEQHGIATSTLQNWLRDAQEAGSESPSPGLVPVHVRDSGPEISLGGEPAVFEIALRSERVLRVPSGFDVHEVRQLVEVLERC